MTEAPRLVLSLQTICMALKAGAKLLNQSKLPSESCFTCQGS